jgi:poly(3-hydroxybutyrate) depolymerase
MHLRTALLLPVLLSLAAPVSGATDSAAPDDPVAALRTWLDAAPARREALASQPFAAPPLTAAQAGAARDLLWKDHVAQVRASRAREWADQSITLDGKTLRWKQQHFGTKPKGGWNLYISLHGGGGAPAGVNDGQWQNQVKLYQPPDSLYVVPRAPTDNWNLWHEAHVDQLFGRLIQDAIVLGDVNPNRVYVMGYSAGGDGVYQLAPRMADRWAAAAMMAGHPNDASPLGLRNIGFTIHVGANDAGYHRNKVAADWAEQLDALRKSDPAGYRHEVSIHEGRGHWMNLEDRVALDWMARFTRNPLPEKVVWHQSSVTHDRFYWLAVPEGRAKSGQLVIASRQGQRIRIEKADGVSGLTFLLSDAMLDLDKPVTVSMNGKTLFEGEVRRTIQSLYSTLQDRGDLALAFDAALSVPIAE